MDQRERRCPVLTSPDLALCSTTTITAAGSHLPTWGKREEERKKNHRAVRYQGVRISCLFLEWHIIPQLMD